MNGIKVCLNCTDRVLGCHSTCKRYTEDKERYLKEKQKIKDAKRGEKQLDTYEVERLRKMRKKQKKRGNYYIK